jgi:hypothetical protein
LVSAKRLLLLLLLLLKLGHFPGRKVRGKASDSVQQTAGGGYLE